MLYVLIKLWEETGKPDTQVFFSSRGLARALKNILQRMHQALESPAYNLVIHTSPVMESTNEFYHWHIELMPKLTKVAGFEWGTGFYINPTPPEEAAQFLRDVQV